MNEKKIIEYTEFTTNFRKECTETSDRVNVEIHTIELELASLQEKLETLTQLRSKTCKQSEVLRYLEFHLPAYKMTGDQFKEKDGEEIERHIQKLKNM